MREREEKAREVAVASTEERLKRRNLEALDAIDKFAVTSGIDLRSDGFRMRWDIEAAGKAVRLLTQLQSRPTSQIADAIKQTEDALAALKAAASVLSISLDLQNG